MTDLKKEVLECPSCGSRLILTNKFLWCELENKRFEVGHYFTVKDWRAFHKVGKELINDDD